MAPQNFNAGIVPLEGSNLIEASAGTGKTYSIAILVVRLVLEKKLPIKEILMVTFTKAAVAELEERIRLFIRSAYKVSLGEHIGDETITNLVNNYPHPEEASRLLKEAVLFLDETSVLTIHSFCQKTLNEFAFETNQLFGAETIQDTSAILQQEINRFWRKNVTTITPGLLGPLIEAGLSRKNMMAVVREHLSGKKYFAFDPAARYTINMEEQEAIATSITRLETEEAVLKEELIKYITEQGERLKKASAANRFAKKDLLGLIDSPVDFIAAITGKRSSNYIGDLYPDILEKLDACLALAAERDEGIQRFIRQINFIAIEEVSLGIEAFKERNNQLSFDDMIVKLHEALVLKNNRQLVQELRKKYKAVFVDEFQDTDRLQYEIFQEAFKTETILFYIGDPKQSIYAWRKADIFTYFKAYEAVDTIYNMNLNFRSSEPMISAMNAFFKPTPDFDTFAFGEAENAINYLAVDSPTDNTKGVLAINIEPIVPITISVVPKNEAIYEAVAAQVIDLLENREYSMNGIKKITPSDIGILVRSNKQGRNIKARLARLGIPAVTIGDDRVLQSDEATYLLYLLDAMVDSTRSNINKALLSPFTGFGVAEILKLDDEQTLGLFRGYKVRWDTDGVYTALRDFVTDFNVQQVLLQHNSEFGERTITNLFHLIELVHKIQSGKLLSPPELISWLKRGIEGMETEGDEYEQRVENDEEAVKIVTIHKSKGLQYNIVLSPFMDFVEPKDATIYSFRDAATGDYVTIEKNAITPGQKTIALQQAEQEHRRLVYVAITRAVYKCFIYRSGYYKSSTLATFTNALGNADPGLIEFAAPLELPTKYRYSRSNGWTAPPPLKAINFALTQTNWTKMSYTLLAAKPVIVQHKSTGSAKDAYDEFVFRLLSKGEKTGNLLHLVFENIHYNNPEKWSDQVTSAIKRFAPQQITLYQEWLPQMIAHILQAEIQTPAGKFSIGDIAYHKRLHEFEFDVPVSSFFAPQLQTLSDDDTRIDIQSSGELEGIMNGKMDMFFEHNGQYFVLDWKSNFLGDQLADYEPAALAAAMSDHNYHLQYLVYSLAITKYLTTRLPHFNYERDFGGVIYVFMRGVRKDSGSGIYFVKPSPAKLDLLSSILNISSPALIS